MHFVVPVTSRIPIDHTVICRDYDFANVIQWFAERADMIIVMFDAHKLDISDELKIVLDTIKPHQEKIRILLNKADTINSQQLMRVSAVPLWPFFLFTG